MPVSPRMPSGADVFLARWLEAERHRLMSDPLSRTWPDYPVCAAALGSVIQEMGRGRPLDEAVCAGVEVGRAALTAYLGALLGSHYGRDTKRK